jgi:hypothetical protein
MSRNGKQPPVHPGEVLLEEFLEPMGLSQNQLALALRVPARRINEIVIASAALPPTPCCGWRAILGCLRNSGWDCRWTTTWTSPKTN